MMVFRNVYLSLFILVVSGALIGLWLYAAPNRAIVSSPGVESDESIQEGMHLNLTENGSEILGTENKVIEAKSKVADKSLIYVTYGAEETTGMSNVRSQEYQLGVGYRLSEAQSFGMVVAKEFADEKDAQAWRRDAETEEQALLKYKLKF
ncbi:MAG: hypothetical protein JW893_04825 [Candidatus Omnitrophica bacterium]|nr:hypothetical protein [Candidatus Omnitrophota bacterium]